jgi:hypothetical protein
MKSSNNNTMLRSAESIGTMEREAISKNRVSPKNVRNRGKILSATIMLLTVLTAWSKPIDENMALKVATQQLSRSSEMRSGSADNTPQKAPKQVKTLQLLYTSSSVSDNANSAMRAAAAS